MKLKIGDKTPDFQGVDEDGNIENIFEKVKTEDHTNQILETIK